MSTIASLLANEVANWEVESGEDHKQDAPNGNGKRGLPNDFVTKIAKRLNTGEMPSNQSVPAVLDVLLAHEQEADDVLSFNNNLLSPTARLAVLRETLGTMDPLFRNQTLVLGHNVKVGKDGKLHGVDTNRDDVKNQESWTRKRFTGEPKNALSAIVKDLTNTDSKTYGGDWIYFWLISKRVHQGR
ncbi:hypothetical protein PG984_009742 [Apiospora sp. TS-2023a]